jgi:hypothetical protein
MPRMTRVLSSLGLIVLTSLAAACAGESDSATNEASQEINSAEPEPVRSEPAGQFTVTLGSAAISSDLSAKVDVDVTVAPAKGFTGEVDLAVNGLSSGVTAAPVHVSLGGGAVQAKLTFDTAATANVTPRDTTVPITVVATSGKETANVAATFKVLPKLTLYIPLNVQALYTAPGGPLRPEWGEAFGPNNKPLRTQADNPIAIAVFNKDTKPHTIHGPNAAFPHGDLTTPIQPNAFEMKNGQVRIRTMKIGDSATGYIHGESGSTNATFKIVVAAVQ